MRQVPAPELVFAIGYSMADGRVMPEADERETSTPADGLKCPHEAEGDLVIYIHDDIWARASS